MAGEWIVWVIGLSRRREVVAIAARLGLSRREVASICMEVWEWCDQEGTFDSSRNCNVAGVTLSWLDELVSVAGFGEAMREAAGWVEERDGSLVFPRLGQWVGKSARERALTRTRQATYRTAHNVGVTPESRESNGESNAASVTKKKNKKENNPPPPTPSSLPTGNGSATVASGGEGGGFSGEWAECMKAARAAGLNDAATAVGAARSAGCSAAELLAVVATYRAAGGRWKTGALHWRIRNSQPGQSPADGWPPPDASGASARAVDERRRKQIAERRTYEIIRAGRIAKLSEAEIRVELTEAGLSWPE